jgi:hypothetical protein
MRIYVVTAPESARGVYETWAACKAKVYRVPGARFQSVDSREEAEALLGDGIILPPGTYAFTDGNAVGGVGIVVLEQGPDSVRLMHEVSTTVSRVFAGTGTPGLESEDEVAAALAKLHNILAELAGLYHALLLIPLGKSITIVYDYKGIGAWMGNAGRPRTSSSPR